MKVGDILYKLGQGAILTRAELEEMRDRLNFMQSYKPEVSTSVPTEGCSVSISGTCPASQLTDLTISSFNGSPKYFYLNTSSQLTTRINESILVLVCGNTHYQAGSPTTGDIEFRMYYYDSADTELGYMDMSYQSYSYSESSFCRFINFTNVVSYIKIKVYNNTDAQVQIASSAIGLARIK